LEEAVKVHHSDLPVRLHFSEGYTVTPFFRTTELIWRVKKK
jgi:hypothetical protein